MFAATQDEDLKWRLSIRRIRTIKTIRDYYGNTQSVSFRSRADAKALADTLNDIDIYDTYFNKHTGLPLEGVSLYAAKLAQQDIVDAILLFDGVVITPVTE